MDMKTYDPEKLDMVREQCNSMSFDAICECIATLQKEKTEVENRCIEQREVLDQMAEQHHAD